MGAVYDMFKETLLPQMASSADPEEVSPADISKIAQIQAQEQEDVDVAHSTWEASLIARNRSLDNFVKASDNLKGAEGHLALVMSEYVMEKRKYDGINVKLQNYQIYYNKQVQKVKDFENVVKELNVTAQAYKDRYESKVAVEEDRITSKKSAAQDRIDRIQQRLDGQKSRLDALDGEILEAKNAISAAKEDEAKAAKLETDTNAKAAAQDVESSGADAEADAAKTLSKEATKSLKSNQETLQKMASSFLQISEDPLLREEHAVEAAGGLDSQLKMLDGMKHPKKQQAAVQNKKNGDSLAPVVDQVRESAAAADDASADMIKKKAMANLEKLAKSAFKESAQSAKERVAEAESEIGNAKFDMDQAVARRKGIVWEVEKIEAELK